MLYKLAMQQVKSILPRQLSPGLVADANDTDVGKLALRLLKELVPDGFADGGVNTTAETTIRGHGNVKGLLSSLTANLQTKRSTILVSSYKIHSEMFCSPQRFQKQFSRVLVEVSINLGDVQNSPAISGQ